MSKARLYQVTATIISASGAERTDIYHVAANTRRQADQAVRRQPWRSDAVQLHISVVNLSGGVTRVGWKRYSVSASSEK